MRDGGRCREEQRESWDRFYSENKRPWRGVGKLPGLEVSEGDRALDIGCGNGKTASALIQAGVSVTGIDFSPNAIHYCEQSFGDRAKFITCDSSSLTFPDSSFEIVTLVHVLELLDDKQLSDTVSEVSRVLVPGGKVLVRAFEVSDMRAGGSDSNVRGNGISYRYFTEEQILSLFDGFEVIHSDTVSEKMRFGGVRVRVEAVLRKLS